MILAMFEEMKKQAMRNYLISLLGVAEEQFVRYQLFCLRACVIIFTLWLFSKALSAYERRRTSAWVCWAFLTVNYITVLVEAVRRGVF